MKKLKFITICALILGTLCITSCQKEAIRPATRTQTSSANQSKPIGQNNVYTKSRENSLYLMAQAANIKSITYNSTNETYSVSTYFNNVTYVIRINHIDPQKVIKMHVDPSSGSTFNFLVKTKQQTVIVHGNKYSFNNYIKYGIGMNQNFGRNLAAVMSAYCLKNPGISTTFSDNGDDDVFNPTSIRPCFGQTRERVYSTDSFGNCITYTEETTYVFWIPINHTIVSEITEC